MAIRQPEPGRDEAAATTDGLEWILISDGIREIGAVGFAGRKTAVIATFYDHRDENFDGEVSIGERIGTWLSPFDLRNRNITEVAIAARHNFDVVTRDPGFPAAVARLHANFASGPIFGGFAALFGADIATVAAPIPGRLPATLVKRFVVRKGMEHVLCTIYAPAGNDGEDPGGHPVACRVADRIAARSSLRVRMPAIRLVIPFRSS